MGQFTRSGYSSGAAIESYGYFWEEFYDIAGAHNLHESGDFGSGDIPLEAVVTNQDRFVFCLSAQSEIPGVVTSATVQQYFVVPFDCTVVGGWFNHLSNNTDPTVFLYREPVREYVSVFGGSDRIYSDTGERVKVFNDMSIVITDQHQDMGAPLISRLSAAT